MFNCILVNVIIFDRQDDGRNCYQAKASPELKNSCDIFLIDLSKLSDYMIHITANHLTLLGIKRLFVIFIN